MGLAHGIRFELPDELAADRPPEARGLARDGVRLLVAERERLRHARFAELDRYLAPGDLLVVNTSRTLAAAVPASRGGVGVVLHFATRISDGVWVVEPRPGFRADGPLRDVRAGERFSLPDGSTLTVEESYPDARLAGSRLWRARVADAEALFAGHGRPIGYGYLSARPPIADYQTIFARETGEGSAEMPSAGRPFSAGLLARLLSAGVLMATVELHTGVSSAEDGEPPQAERFAVPAPTAALVNQVRAAGNRVVAVGTTVTRALESVADEFGTVVSGGGWTDLVLGPHRPARVVDGLITGWHAPGASHLLLLEAVAGERLVSSAYAEALRERYLWHEFGDSALLLP